MTEEELEQQTNFNIDKLEVLVEGGKTENVVSNEN